LTGLALGIELGRPVFCRFSFAFTVRWLTDLKKYELAKDVGIKRELNVWNSRE
jgi:hypothetical protein